MRNGSPSKSRQSRAMLEPPSGDEQIAIAEPVHTGRHLERMIEPLTGVAPPTFHRLDAEHAAVDFHRTARVRSGRSARDDFRTLGERRAENRFEPAQFLGRELALDERIAAGRFTQAILRIARHAVGGRARRPWSWGQPRWERLIARHDDEAAVSPDHGRLDEAADRALLAARRRLAAKGAMERKPPPAPSH